MYAGTAAAVAAGATAGTGTWLFSYNKDNFGYDAGMRFGRFMMARGFANQQVGQYREDIQGITGMTVTKMDAWQSVTTLFLAVGAALSCAGRIGMHGSAPPGWYCALFSGSIFMSVMFNGISLWLSMHASLRAQCAAVSLLTRKVRLPIPSMSQLDQARVFASAYEKQEYRDIFRVPFMRHTEDAPAAAAAVAAEAKPAKGKKKVAADATTTDFGSTSRDTVPSWIRDEVVLDKAGGVIDGEGELHPASEAPDHFKLLMKAQEEWRDYDVYARISMLYGVISFLYAVTYYAVGYAICELRGFWAMWSLPIVFITAQALIFRLDILRTGNQRLPNAEILGHLAPYFAVAACTLEYRYYYSEAQVAVTWGLVYMAYLGHFMMALRMLDLAWPAASAVELPEEPGRQWWPRAWAVPSGFTKHLWFITPPKKLEDGQNCLLHEMENLKAAGGGISASTCRRRKAATSAAPPRTMEDANDEDTGVAPSAPDYTKRPNDMPWRLVRWAIIAAAFQWFFMMIASGVEIVMGPETLLKPPGEPPWIRDTKYRTWGPGVVHTSANASLPEGYRLFTAAKARYSAKPDAAAHGAGEHTAKVATAAHATDAHGAGHHRRLATSEEAVVQELLDAVPLLSALAAKAAAGAPEAQLAELPQPPSTFMAPGPKAHDIEWPPMFEPRHLLCAPKGESSGRVVALTRRGFGAVIPHQDGARAAPFALDGLEGALAGASWTPRGLLLVTTRGEVLRCHGAGPDAATSAWRCSGAATEEFAELPMPEGGRLRAAAIAERSEEEGGSLVALVYEHLPEVVGVFRIAAGVWHPHGELRASGAHLAFAGDDELIVTTRTGEVLRRAAGGGPTTAIPSTPANVGSREVQAACAPHDGDLLRLALRRDGGGAWGPELLAAA